MLIAAARVYLFISLLSDSRFLVALALAAVLFSLAAAELASDPAAVLRLTTAIPPVSLDDS